MVMFYVTLLHAIMCSEFLIDIWQSQTFETLWQKKKLNELPQTESPHFQFPKHEQYHSPACRTCSVWM